MLPSIIRERLSKSLFDTWILKVFNLMLSTKFVAIKSQAYCYDHHLQYMHENEGSMLTALSLMLSIQR